MRFEVEQKFRAGSLDQVTERLARMGASPGQPLEQEDSYLGHPCRDFAQTNEALRIRRVGGANAITYKGPKREGPTKTREEIEVPFADGPDALDGLRRVFEALGFRPVFVVRKVRTPYHLTEQGRPIEVALDVVEGLGSFVEVETIADGEDDLPAAQRAVTDLARSLGLSNLEPRSYLRMALEHRAAAADG
jgi:adenylate cyclase class 2